DLDALGNWSGFATDANGDGDYTDAADLDQSRDANAANEITDVTEGQGQTAWATPVYDDAGNMITGPGGKAAELSTSVDYVYDAWNRLVKAYRDTGEWYQQWEQRLYYDGQGQLIATGSVDYGVGIYHRMDYYLNAAAQVVEARWAVAEDFGSVATLARYQYVWGLNGATPVLRDADTSNPPNQDGNCTDETSERLYYTHDANDNVTALVQTDGTVAARYGYETRGAPIFYNAAWAVQSNDLKNSQYLFASYQYLSLAGLYHAGARDLHPYVGTWMQKDPIGLADGMNPRTYCLNNPMNGRDPSGLAIMLSSDVSETPSPSFMSSPFLFPSSQAPIVDSVPAAQPTSGYVTDWGLLLGVPTSKSDLLAADPQLLQMSSSESMALLPYNSTPYDNLVPEYLRGFNLEDVRHAQGTYPSMEDEAWALERGDQELDSMGWAAAMGVLHLAQTGVYIARFVTGGEVDGVDKINSMLDEVRGHTAIGGTAYEDVSRWSARTAAAAAAAALILQSLAAAGLTEIGTVPMSQLPGALATTGADIVVGAKETAAIFYTQTSLAGHMVFAAAENAIWTGVGIGIYTSQAMMGSSLPYWTYMAGYGFAESYQPGMPSIFQNGGGIRYGVLAGWGLGEAAQIAEDQHD
ncbi:MAG: RHS repeat-associated core domain-containing protein, partial [Phycisphaerae bacterium]